ncbi:hypothetical protein [Metabacillus dongyingensis]|uniref:hypothetical protein n=1 Tax=Metabacillus dongyingensis TaxID=2874282 RepID=UPI001CBDF43E|nr:hypothetical protein [Metabacillus dongyingensis]UAL51853.1 hypothetical protein K8L98_22270 [Metabacillus dongyingensis]
MIVMLVVVSFIYAMLAVIYTVTFIEAIAERKRYKLPHLLHLILWFTGAAVLSIYHAGTHLYWIIYLLVSISIAAACYSVSFFRGKQIINKTVFQLIKIRP